MGMVMRNPLTRFKKNENDLSGMGSNENVFVPRISDVGLTLVRYLVATFRLL